MTTFSSTTRGRVRGSRCALPPYLCLEFGGGAELKEELHDIIVTLLGGEEEGGRACLERVTKIDAAASCSDGNNFLCLCEACQKGKN